MFKQLIMALLCATLMAPASAQVPNQDPAIFTTVPPAPTIQPPSTQKGDGKYRLKTQAETIKDEEQAVMAQQAALARDQCYLPAGFAFPENTQVVLVEAYQGVPIKASIDGAKHASSRLDLAVNFPNRKLALILIGNEPIIWNLQWTEGTEILGVIARGGNRQVVSGLDDKIPILVNTQANGYGCTAKLKANSALPGYIKYFESNTSKLLAHVKLDSATGPVQIGVPLKQNAKLTTSPNSRAERFYVDRK